MLAQSIRRNSLLLGIFAVLSTALVSTLALGTKDRIADNVRQAQQMALREIIPDERHSNDLLDDTVTLNDEALLGLREPKPAFLARQGNEVVAAIVPVTARDGYTGDIDLIVGINRDGSIAGVRALSHRETPGLGDKIDYRKSHWVDGFIGKSLNNPLPEQWKVKKDAGVFDQFTGATITPRAVTRSVLQALQFTQSHHDQLFGSSAQETHHE